jgi:hypothetical protein
LRTYTLSRMTSPLLRALATVLLGAAGAGLIGAGLIGVEPARAEPAYPCYQFTFVSSGLMLGADPNGDYQPGQSVVQIDPAQVPEKQKDLLDWCDLPGPYVPGLLMNKGIGLCITENGFRQTLTFESCVGRPAQRWAQERASYNGQDVYHLKNPDSSYCADVYHDSHESGADVIAYSEGRGLNQWMYRADV